MRSFIAIANEIIKKLKDGYGIHSYIYHKAVTSNSVYVKFEDNRIGSIRLADHTGRGKYRYRFNVRSDIPESYTENDRGVLRYYFRCEHTDTLVDVVIARFLDLELKEAVGDGY